MERIHRVRRSDSVPAMSIPWFASLSDRSPLPTPLRKTELRPLLRRRHHTFVSVGLADVCEGSRLRESVRGLFRFFLRQFIRTRRPAHPRALASLTVFSCLVRLSSTFRRVGPPLDFRCEAVVRREDKRVRIVQPPEKVAAASGKESMRSSAHLFGTEPCECEILEKTLLENAP